MARRNRITKQELFVGGVSVIGCGVVVAMTLGIAFVPSVVGGMMVGITTNRYMSRKVAEERTAKRNSRHRKTRSRGRWRR